MQDPAAIYQENLDIVSNAIMQGDAGAAVGRFAIPMLLRTLSSEMMLERAEDLIEDTSRHSQALHDLGVTHYVRLVKKAAYLTEELIEGWHETFALRGANLVVPSYRSRLILRLDDGIWKVAEGEHELGGERFPAGIVRPEPGAFDKRWRQSYDDIRATHARAEPIYQAVLDTMSALTIAGDFDGWAGTFTFPHDVHYDATDHVAYAPKDVAAFFSHMQERLETLGADAMPRRARYAEFVSGNRIIGYHDTCLSKNGETVFGPVRSRMMLRLDDDTWLCTAVTNSLSNRDLDIKDFQLSTTLPPMREIQERMRNG